MVENVLSVLTTLALESSKAFSLSTTFPELFWAKNGMDNKTKTIAKNRDFI
jgi:hypothetical protein